jgi:hypothetical protein
MVIQRGSSDRKGEAYSTGYVKPLSDVKTKLGTIFTILP